MLKGNNKVTVSSDKNLEIKEFKKNPEKKRKGKVKRGRGKNKKEKKKENPRKE